MELKNKITKDYDSSGNLIECVHANLISGEKSVTRIEYDHLNRKIKCIQYNDKVIFVLNYYGDSNKITEVLATDLDGVFITEDRNEYNEDGNLVKQFVNGDLIKECFYDKKGRIIKCLDFNYSRLFRKSVTSYHKGNIKKVLSTYYSGERNQKIKRNVSTYNAKDQLIEELTYMY